MKPHRQPPNRCCGGLRVHVELTQHAAEAEEACAEGTPDAPPALPVTDEWSCSDAH